MKKKIWTPQAFKGGGGLIRKATFQEEVNSWQEQTFPNATPQSVMAHLAREVVELAKAMASGDLDAVEDECADILILLLGMAGRLKFDLVGAAWKKFEINKKRKWGEPDAEGVVEHVEKPCDAAPEGHA